MKRHRAAGAGRPRVAATAPVKAMTSAAAPPVWLTAASKGQVAVPLHALFGSEELSAQAPVMQSRIPSADALVAAAQAGAAANVVGVPVGLAGAPVTPGGES